MFSFYLLTYVRHSLLPTVRYLWSTLKRILKSNKGFLELSPSIVKEKQFPLIFLLLLICSISLGGRCCIPLFTVQFYSMNARVERVCRNGTRGGGARVDKWVGPWEVPTLFPKYRVSLVISRYLFNKHSSLCKSCLKFETSL